jgi:FKBP-type peptidyl-prolyl cis-trans isomerase
MSVLKYLWIFAGFVLLGCSCSHQNNSVSTPNENKPATQEEIIQMNRNILAIERRTIDAYIEENNWKTEQTGTGLHIEVTRDSAGNYYPKEGDLVTLDYTLSLIDGEEVYNSVNNGRINLRVDKDNNVSGLHEAVKKMTTGDQARLIIPSHLGYGVHGDENKVPSRATLIMTVEILSIEPI